MAPKPQVFKTPDGKEFSTRAEWRDYMMLTFYSFKNKVDEPEPLMKLPGSIEGQMFDIADCKNSTLLVLDHTEQVQIDQVSDCKIFLAACASSIFIRNCTNCTFYTSCRQLRLREVVNCTFYIYSMAEVHIEYSNGLRFAPFNGGYPDHAKHLAAANLDLSHNLWYDIYDHNDPGKTHANWSLLPESEYEAPWFPLGNCEPAIPRTKPGHVERAPTDNNMQSFSLQQMIQDSKDTVVHPTRGPPPPTTDTNKIETTTVAPAPPVPPPMETLKSNSNPSNLSAEDTEIVTLLTSFAQFKVGVSLNVRNCSFTVKKIVYFNILGIC
jgi:protein XRP2